MYALQLGSHLRAHLDEREFTDLRIDLRGRRTPAEAPRSPFTVQREEQEIGE